MTPLLLKALRCENFNSRPPVWLMRQAGRYMPQYRALREQYTFLEMCRTPEIAAEVTQLPIDAFGMDAAILFSDILVTVAALGLDLHFDDGIGPVIDNPIATTEQVYHLPTPNVEEKLGYVRDA
ncbi:MAG: uroporphyrinogen decarboxylase, partial [Chlamydiales bacterium]|nr:uroporphyrinogen decarboxylase [Chlamydiales bacterium]